MVTALPYTAENLWKAIHHGNESDCEQFLWNHALKDLGLMWNVTTNISQLCEVKTGWQSYGPLASIVFPQNIFCRKCCKTSSLSRCYVVHRNGEHLDTTMKQKKLKKSKSWFLRDNWKNSGSSSQEGDSWINSIYSNVM